MSTLPRLDPSKYRQTASALGSYQANAYQKSNASTSDFQNNSFAQTVPSKNFNFMLQGVREAILRKYDLYNSQIRQLDRNFTLQVRRSDQASIRALSKMSDSISSISAEMNQLSSRANIIQRKLSSLNKTIDSTSTTGLQTTIKPIVDNFDAFEKDFTKSLSSINALFSTLSKRTDSVVKDYNDIFPIMKSISELDSEINEAEQSQAKNFQNLEDTRRQLMELISEQRQSLIQSLSTRIQGLETKIDILEKRSQATLQNSQDIVADAQNSQYELRKQFEMIADSTEETFKKQLEAVKINASEMNKNRLQQLEIIRSRLAAAKESMAKLKRKKMKQDAMITEESVPRISLRPEIDRLKEKIENLEIILKEKKGLISPMETRVFYRITDDGIKYIKVKPDGSVLLL